LLQLRTENARLKAELEGIRAGQVSDAEIIDELKAENAKLKQERDEHKDQVIDGLKLIEKQDERIILLQSRLIEAQELLEVGSEIVSTLCKFIPKNTKDSSGTLKELLGHADKFLNDVFKQAKTAG
jgi:uncharacterized membrane-anchored protein YjiN (DUF445 family)